MTAGNRPNPHVAVDVLLESATGLPDDMAPWLEAQLAGAVADLGLAGRARVRTAAADMSGDAIRVSVNDAQFPLAGFSQLKSPEMVRQVLASALHADRSAWVTRAGIERLRTAMAPGLATAADGVLHWAAGELARRGVSVVHLASAASGLDSAQPADPVTIAEEAMAATTARVAIRMAPADILQRAGTEDLDQLPEVLWTLRGLIIPAVRLEPDPALPPGYAQVRINDICLPGSRPRDSDAAGTGKVALLAREAALQHAGSLLTAQVTEFLLDKLAAAFPLVVSAARARMSDEQITAVLRVLLDEGVSIGDLRAVLEGLLEALQDLGDVPRPEPAGLAAAARRWIGLTLIQEHLTAGMLRVHPVQDARGPANGCLAERTVIRLHEDLAALGTATEMILLTPAPIAAQLRTAIRLRFSVVRVVSEDEVPPGLDLQRDESVSLRG